LFSVACHFLCFQKIKNNFPLTRIFHEISGLAVDMILKERICTGFAFELNRAVFYFIFIMQKARIMFSIVWFYGLMDMMNRHFYS